MDRLVAFKRVSLGNSLSTTPKLTATCTEWHSTITCRCLVDIFPLQTASVTISGSQQSSRDGLAANRNGHGALGKPLCAPKCLVRCPIPVRISHHWWNWRLARNTHHSRRLLRRHFHWHLRRRHPYGSYLLGTAVHYAVDEHRHLRHVHRRQCKKGRTGGGEGAIAILGAGYSS